MDVPEIVSVSVSLPFQAEVMLTPGANRSTTDPKFEKLPLTSLMSLAPTVRASATPAGLQFDESSLAFAAATAYVTPALMEFRTASSIEKMGPNPARLMLATAVPEGLPLWALVTKLTPAMIASRGQLPDPLQTFTERMVTFFATPYVAPPIVPATCVP